MSGKSKSLQPQNPLDATCLITGINSSTLREMGDLQRLSHRPGVWLSRVHGRCAAVNISIRGLRAEVVGITCGMGKKRDKQ